MIGVKKVDVPAGQTPVASNAHRVFVIDCSGSMSYDLPQLRQELKQRLPILTQPGDLVSLVWFSGKHEFGTLVEALPVKSLTDFVELNKASQSSARGGAIWNEKTMGWHHEKPRILKLLFRN